MLIIFTGNGKGKTTAALGQAMRAVGNGSRVLMVQFIKGPWKSGEDTSSKVFGDDLRIVKMGRGFVGTLSDKLTLEEHSTAAHDALAYSLKELKTRKWNILILDEVWAAHHLKLISSADITSFIEDTTLLCEHLILTGRNCPKEFIEKADLVTEMKEIKHPFSKGVMAKKGVEF